VSWAIVGCGAAFFVYGMFFTDGYMDAMLSPLLVHVRISHTLVPRIIAWFFSFYQLSAFIFSQTTTFVLAALFSHQFKKVMATLGQSLDNPQKQVSDSDIETMRQKHQEISMNVDHVDIRSFNRNVSTSQSCSGIFPVTTVLAFVYVALKSWS